MQDLEITTTTVSVEQRIGELRQRAKDAVAQYPTAAAAAKDSGIAYSTFQAWLGDAYGGNNERVAAEIDRWLNAREERRRATSALPVEPGFVRTATAQKIIQTLTITQATRDFAVITGAPGIGKTITLQHYRATNPNVWLSTMQPSTSGVATMLREICKSMAITERSATALADAIGAKVQGTGGLILIDEAQHLSSVALDQLRSIRDLNDVAIAISGNPTVYGQIDGGPSRRGHFAQLSSRVGMRMTQNAANPSDVCDLINAWAITDDDEIRYLKQIAKKPGALRGMTKTLRLASMLAAGADEPRGIRHIRQAWTQLAAPDTAGDAA